MEPKQPTTKDSIQMQTQHANIDSLKTELSSSSENPIDIKSVDVSGVDWGIIPTIIAVITTGILIFDRIKKSKIGVKVISLGYSLKATQSGTGMDTKPYSIIGQRYFFKLSIQVL